MFRKTTLRIIILMALSLYGCAASIHSFTDEATRACIVRMNGNRLAGSIWRLELDAQRHEKNGATSYSLFVVYNGPGFVTIDPGKSLSLTIDGRRTEIEGSGSERHREIILPGLIEETAFYHDIDKDLFRKIVSAHQVTVEVRGSRTVLQRYFKEKNFSNFKAFYEEVVLRDVTSDSKLYHGAKRKGQ